MFFLMVQTRSLTRELIHLFFFPKSLNVCKDEDVVVCFLDVNVCYFHHVCVSGL